MAIVRTYFTDKFDFYTLMIQFFTIFYTNNNLK